MTGKADTDPTFRNYKAEQAARYAAYRDAYPEQLIRMIIDAHASGGGKFDSLLDVGCGPGTATRQLAPHFQHAIGVDPGQAMIETARGNALRTGSGEDARFEVCGAEDIDKYAEPGTVDLITSATAAHWFDLPKFYALAAKLLRPGGSIIFWCGGEYFVDADTPNAEEVRRLWQELETIIEPYELPGNKHARQLYANLALPWTIDTDDEALRASLSSFDQGLSSREVLNPNGEKDDRFEGGYVRHMKLPFGKVKAVLGTASPVTRWREANKEKLEKGEVEDYVDKSVRLTKETMAKATGGVDVDIVGFATSMVVIVIKKRSTE